MLSALRPLVRRIPIVRSHALHVPRAPLASAFHTLQLPARTTRRMYTVPTSPAIDSKQLSPPSAPGTSTRPPRNSTAAVEFVRHVRQTFEDAYGHPSVTSATLLQNSDHPSVVTLEYSTSQRDFARSIKRRAEHTSVLSLSDTGVTVLAKSSPTDSATASAKSRSPHDPSLHVVLRKDDKKHYVEVWRNESLLKTVSVGDKHGDFYGDSTFGGIAWSRDSNTVVYAAEQPEFAIAKDDDGAIDGDITGGIADDLTGAVAGVADPRRYALDSDWGETFNGKRPPVLVALDIATSSISVIPGVENVSPGQVQFLPEQDGVKRIVFTGYKHDVRKHGIVYCQNRPTALFVSDLDGNNVDKIAEGSVRSPRVTPSGRGIVYICTPLGGPHAATSELCMYEFASKLTIPLVPIINRPLDKAQSINGTLLPEGFVGLYVDQLPLNPWVSSEHCNGHDVLVFASTWRSTHAVLSLDVQARKLSRHSPVDGTASYSVISASGDLVVATRSTPAQPSALVLGRASKPADSTQIAIQWHDIGKPQDTGLEWCIVPGDRDSCESIFVYPAKHSAATRYFWTDSNPESRPLVVQPHGGPHSAYTLDFSPMTAALVQLGFGVLLVNFTGSLGFGQDAVLAQIGQCDTLSLNEIQHAARAVQQSGGGDPAATVYVGGSYSGYTGALLAGTAPGFYRGIALRNPVISIGENAAMTDIPDWCWAELGLDYDFANPPEITPQAFAKMWDASPSRLVDRVVDPMLLLLGASDRRVPHQQSLNYYYRLKAAAKADVQCKIYPDVGHPLDTIEAERDSFVSIARFFAKSLGK